MIDGSLAANGMVSFASALSEGDAEAIRAYVLKQAHDGAEMEAMVAAAMAAEADAAAAP